MSRHAFIAPIALLAIASSSAAAQVANASTAATGLGGAYTARGQGYNAVYWNPANLAMPGNPGFSFTLGALDGNAGIRPIGFNDVKPYGDIRVPYSVREQWLQKIEADGSQRGNLGGGVTALGLSIGSLAFQVSTGIAGQMDLSPGAAESFLFGNAGRDTINHTPKSLDLASSALQTSVFSSGAVSYGLRLPMIPLSNFAVGVTGKYIFGHAVGVANAGTSSTFPSIELPFPYVHTDTLVVNENKASGSGIGLDLGASWTIPGFRFGVSLQNVVNTFKWDTTTLVLSNASAVFRSDSSGFTTGMDDEDITLPYSSAPQVIKDKIVAMKFKPVFAAGVSFDWLPRITVSADIRQQAGDGIEVGPKSMIGAGAEVRWLPFLPLRGGVQMMSGGFGVSGGFGLRLAGFEAGVAGFVRKREGAQESGVTINAISIRP